MSYNEAKKYVQSLKLKNVGHFWASDIIDSIPRTPPSAYKDQWENWGIFLGIHKADYEEAKKFANFHKISGEAHWIEFCKNKKDFPKNIPKAPRHFYSKKGTWKSWGEFLNTKMVNYEEAKKYVILHKITSETHWKDFYKNKKDFPKNIPKAPKKIYSRQGTWKGWNDFFNRKKIDKKIN